MPASSCAEKIFAKAAASVRSGFSAFAGTERGAPCSSRMPHDGVIFIAERDVMAITAIAPDVRINAREVPKPIRRRAYKLFEGDRNRSRTPEPVASLAKQEGTVQWKQTDQTNNR